MKRQFLLLYSVVVLAHISAQTSFKTIYGSSRPDEAYDLVQTSDGGFAIGGSTIAHGDRNMYLIRTDSLGDTLWTSEYDTGGDEICLRVFEIGDGGFLIVGNWMEDITDYGNRVVVIRTDDNGNEIWARHYRGWGYSFCTTSMLTSDSFLIVGGITDTIPIFYTQPFLMKIDLQGNLLWTTRYLLSNFPLWPCFYSMHEAPDGTYLCAGVLRKANTGGYGGLIFSVDTAGYVLWGSQIHWNGHLGIYDFTMDVTGEIRATGEIYSLATGYSLFIMSLDQIGTPQWIKQYRDSNASVYPINMYRNSLGQTIIGGSTETFPLQGFVAVFDDTGNVISSHRSGSTQYCTYTGSVLTSDGGVAFCGIDYIGHVAGDTGSILLHKGRSNGTTNCGDESGFLVTSTIQLSDSVFTVAFGRGGMSDSSVTCTSQRGALVVTLCGTSISELSDHDVISVFPNPATDVITIHTPFVESEFNLYNNLGQCVRRVNLVGTKTEISVAELPEGVYYYNVIDENGKVYSDKLVIQ